MVALSAMIEGHAKRIAQSFAGQNGVVTRSVPWGEFQTVAVMTRDGPLWFPIGNLSHISGQETDVADAPEGQARPMAGVIHLKNGCFYVMAIDFESTRQLIVRFRLNAFKNFTEVGLDDDKENNSAGVTDDSGDNGDNDDGDK